MNPNEYEKITACTQELYDSEPSRYPYRFLTLLQESSLDDRRRIVLDECDRLIYLYNRCIGYIEMPDDAFISSYDAVMRDFRYTTTQLYKSVLNKPSIRAICYETNLKNESLFLEALDMFNATCKLDEAMIHKRNCLEKKLLDYQSYRN